MQVCDGYATPLMSQCVTDEVDKWECRSPPTQVRMTDSRRTRVSHNRFLRSTNYYDMSSADGPKGQSAIRQPVQ